MYCSNLWLIYWMFSYFLVGKHGRYDIFYCCVRGAHPEACFFFFEQLWNSHITMYPGVGTTYPTHPPTMRMALVEDSSQTHDENLFVSMHNLVSLKRSLMGVFFLDFSCQTEFWAKWFGESAYFPDMFPTFVLAIWCVNFICWILVPSLKFNISTWN